MAEILDSSLRRKRANKRKCSSSSASPRYTKRMLRSATTKTTPSPGRVSRFSSVLSPPSATAVLGRSPSANFNASTGAARPGQLRSTPSSSHIRPPSRLVLFISPIRTYSATSHRPTMAYAVPGKETEDELLGIMDIHTFDEKASAPFRLSPKFVAKFRDRQPPFGFNGLGGTFPSHDSIAISRNLTQMRNQISYTGAPIHD